MKEIDVKENNIWLEMPEVLKELLRDHTTRKNIFWATHDYESLGEGFDYKDEILPERVTGEYGEVIMPRVLKSKKLQTERAKDMAEVFTPSWVCNAQNNLVDEAWFGRKNVFYSRGDRYLSHSSHHTQVPVPVTKVAVVESCKESFFILLIICF